MKDETATCLPKQLIEKLTTWYEENKRDLPWRQTKNPYAVWVSEIMLQQTRVETVIPYYERFLSVLPDEKALADCPEDRLLKLWEGLGYYSRVRNMQKAAQIICSPDGFSGKFPDSYESLRSLPGLGAYTAGAIASIAFGEKVPAVDGNALRILTRLMADERLIDQEKNKRAISQELIILMAEEKETFSPGDFNQSFMDLGSLVCLQHAAPRCELCPLKEDCRAHALGEEEAFPKKAPKKERRIEERTILRIRDGERILIDKRPSKGLLAGLWEFPNAFGHLSEEEALSFTEQLGLQPLQIVPLPEAKHIFTHIEWHMTGYEIRVASFEGKVPVSGSVLVTPEELMKSYPMPSAFRAYR